jgi:hypothetical protein
MSRGRAVAALMLHQRPHAEYQQADQDAEQCVSPHRSTIASASGSGNLVPIIIAVLGSSCHGLYVSIGQ